MRAGGAARVSFEPYAIIAFDFDGVILDSNRFKTAIFQSVLADFGFSAEQLADFRAFQEANFGTSRYRLFERALAGQFGPPPEGDLAVLLEEFGKRCRDEYPRQPETPGMREALARAGQGGRGLYVVSGSDEEELGTVAQTLRLNAVFDAIFGSPRKKRENLQRARSDHAARGGHSAAPLLFLGDAMADMDAAEAAGCDFVFVAGHSADRARVESAALERGWPVIEDLRQVS